MTNIRLRQFKKAKMALSFSQIAVGSMLLTGILVVTIGAIALIQPAVICGSVLLLVGGVLGIVGCTPSGHNRNN